MAGFFAGLPAPAAAPLCVVVMPQVLHFLLPCLSLLRGHVPLVLLGNGAAPWEMTVLRQRLPEAPQMVLARLPASSVDHGDLVGLLLHHHPGDFGIVDHDAYLFDSALLARLQPQPGDAVVTAMADHHPGLPMVVPLTHLMMFRTEELRALMHQTGVGARLYRRTPAVAQAAFQALGLPPGRFLKPYQRFHDTLHVLLVLAHAQGLRVREQAPAGTLQLVHIGGTSLGSHHTKSMFALYVHLRFLALADDEVARRYRHLVHPLRTPEHALALRRPGDPAWNGLPLLEDLMPRLQQALAAAWPAQSSTSFRSP